MSDFLTDEQMNELEKTSATAADSSPDFISDDEISKYEAPAPEESLDLGPVVKPVAGGAAGYVLGKVGQKGAELADEYLVPAIGRLDGDQINTITNKAPDYKNAPALENLINQWKDMSQGIQHTGIKSADDARKSLEGLPNVPVQKVYDAMSVEPTNPKYSTPIDPGTKANIFRDHLNQVKPDVDQLLNRQNEVNSRLSQIEDGTILPQTDESLKLREKQLNESYDRKMSNLDSAKSNVESTPKPSTDALDLRERQLNQSYDRKMASPENVDQSQLTFQKNQAQEKVDLSKFQKEKSQVAKLEDKLKELEARKQEAAFRKSQADERLNLSKAKKDQSVVDKIAKEQESLLKERESLVDSISKKLDKASEGAKRDYSKVSNAPQELGLPDDRFIRSEYSNQLHNAVDKVKSAKNTGIEPVVLDQIVQELRQGVDFDGQTDQVKGFNKGLSENVRKQALDEATFPEYNEGMNKSHVAQNAQDSINKFTGVQFDKNPNDISFPEQGRARLTTLLEDPKNANRAELMQELVKAEKAGVIPVDSAKKFFETGDLSVIKNIVNTSDTSKIAKLGKAAGKAGAGAVVGGLVGGQQGSVIGAGLGLGAEMYGTKLQELIALQKAGKIGQGLKAVNSALPGIFGGIGAGLSAMGAVHAGELTPGEGVAAAAGETANPVPMTDVVQGLVDAKKAGATAQAEMGDRDPNFEAEMAQYGDLGTSPSQTITSANPVEAAKQAGFLKGFTSPVPALAGLGKDVLEGMGNSQSQDARARMEQNFGGNNTRTDYLRNTLQNTPEDLKGGFAYKQAEQELNKLTNGNKALRQATPDQLMELSQSFKDIKGADKFVAPLENAAQADSDEERKARLFGLYQQPAFRQLLNKNNKS